MTHHNQTKVLTTWFLSYYLADGIYPSWATFVKTIPKSRGNKKKYFAKPQKVCRKDVEHTFDVLQSHFAIVHGSARLWDEDSLKNIMMVCIIMYNMIVKDEAEEDNDFNYNQMGERVILSPRQCTGTGCFHCKLSEDQEQENTFTTSKRFD
jgi:hypothetical protein